MSVSVASNDVSLVDGEGVISQLSLLGLSESEVSTVFLLIAVATSPQLSHNQSNTRV